LRGYQHKRSDFLSFVTSVFSEAGKKSETTDLPKIRNKHKTYWRKHVRALRKPEYVFELVNDSVMIRSSEGRINFWNHSAEKLYGWKKEEALGRVSHDLLQTQFPKSLKEIESELIRNRRWEGKLVHTTRQGNRVIVQSRWSLEPEGQLGRVVEINRRSTNAEARIDSDLVRIGKDEARPTSKLVKADGRLSKIVSIVLAAGALLCILVAFYAFTKYSGDPIGKLIYGVVPIGFSVLLFSSLRFKPNHKINFALLCLSLTASAYGVELVLRGWLDSAPKEPLMNSVRRSRDKENYAAELSNKLGVQIDPRNASEVLADLNKKHLSVIPFVSPSNNLLIVEREGYRKSVISVAGTEVIPLGGISNKMTLLCNENGQWVSYKSDVHGFNNPDSTIWKSPGVAIAALGDSFTQGYCVPPQKSFIGIIRERYPMTLNLGIAGNGPLMMLATMREYLHEVKPKIVLWFYCEDNDLWELQGERRTALLRRYLENDFTQGLAARQTQVDDAMMKDIPRQEALEEQRRIRRQQTPKFQDKLVNIRHKSVDIAKLSLLRTKLNMPRQMQADELAALTDMEGPNLDLFARILAQAKSHVNAWNGKMYFVYLPSWGRHAKISDKNLLLEMKQRARLLSIVNSLQIPTVDIAQVFEAQEDPLSFFPFRGPGHYNENGHRAVAEELLKRISFIHPFSEPRVRTIQE
jgi:PAS domain S-box-containing protein